MSRTATSARTARAPASTRTVALVLAHTHLRLGSLALARVELETLAGLGALDTIGQVDLAEVRWRTGDLFGAGEMATAALQAEEVDPVALIIASEAASALGRPSEARRLAMSAIARAPDSIDAIFAGMPRSGVWPADGAEPAPTAPTLFDRGPETAVEATGVTRPADDLTPGGPPPATAVASLTLGFWDGDVASETDAAALPDPTREFEAGRTALVSGALDQAALHFSLALRLAPALAPTVLEVTDGARSPSLMVVRGDAYRLAGHETEARRAYAVAAEGGLPERRQRVRVRSKARSSMSPLAVSLDGLAAADGAGPVADQTGSAAATPDDEVAPVADGSDASDHPSGEAKDDPSA